VGEAGRRIQRSRVPVADCKEMGAHRRDPVCFCVFVHIFLRADDQVGGLPAPTILKSKPSG
jgi:hypothetical protein